MAQRFHQGRMVFDPFYTPKITKKRAPQITWLKMRASPCLRSSGVVGQMLNLFEAKFSKDRLHPIFTLISRNRHAPEREVLNRWAEGFTDRDGKFVDEFQLTFEAAMWELYLHAVLKELGCTTDMSFDAPDFVVTGPIPLTIEATIAKPAVDGQPAFGFDAQETIPKDFGELNHEAALRLCNSISAKHEKYKSRYSKLPQSQDLPFVIGLAAFDRPYAHMAVNRPIMAALYGHYIDESDIYEEDGKQHLGQYHVQSAIKPNGSTVPMGIFLDDSYADISAIIFSPVATWGKIRALAKNTGIPAVFTTLHPVEGSIHPERRQQPSNRYEEHLLDGLYVFHNPYAKKPLAPSVFNHERVAQLWLKENGEYKIICPDDFLMYRQIMSVTTFEEGEIPPGR